MEFNELIKIVGDEPAFESGVLLRSLLNSRLPKPKDTKRDERI